MTLSEVIDEIENYTPIPGQDWAFKPHLTRFLSTANDDEKAQIRRAVAQVNKQSVEVVNQAIQQAKNYLVHSGQEYLLDEWVTIVEYSRRYALDPRVVTNWIRRGIIPPDKVHVVPELNNLRLVYNQPYRT